MNENEKKNAIVKAMTEVECVPVFEDNQISEQRSKISLDKIASMGIAFQPMVSAFQKLTGQVGKEGLYRVTFPPQAKGGTLVSFNDNSGFMGGIKIAGENNFAGQARLNQIPCDPTMICMAVAMMSINQKLDAIQEAQKEIIEFLQLKEKAKLKGNLSVLQEILDEYKFNWNNEKFKNNKYIQVQEIKRDSEQSIVLCRELIEKKANKKINFIHGDGSVKTKMQKLQNEFKDYELALYLYAFSSFLEVMLLENFDNGYLNSVTSKINLYANQCNDLYKIALQRVENELKTSVQSGVLKGVAGINKAIGGTIAKIPKIRDGQVDENLIEAGEKVDKFNEQRTENAIQNLSKDYTVCVLPFVDNINAVNKIYNEPMEVLFDSENLYFKLTD
ncbi:MAG: hypothetical protein IKA02_06690 [Clostridia bacterium]|nr:hypothetical protein [Clostridia bacterium]